MLNLYRSSLECAATFYFTEWGEVLSGELLSGEVMSVEILTGAVLSGVARSGRDLF
jgi:hypothetical protein